MYDPSTERWMTIDRLRELDVDQYGYTYVNHHPINQIDLTGIAEEGPVDEAL